MIEKRYIFPLFLLACNVGAAVVAFIGCDAKRGVYWLSSALCIAMVASNK